MSIQRLTDMQGFSLVEMAVVLMILGIILNGLLVAMGKSTENTRRLDAKNELQQIQEALYGFAQVHGRLPCPASNNTNGYEDPTSGTGVCTYNHGLLPNATLNLSGRVNSDGLMLDPWANPYRYSVGTSPTSYRYTTTSGISSIFAAASSEVVADNNMLRICDSSSCTGNVIADTVPAVVLSMGSNWADIESSSSANETANVYGADDRALGSYPIHDLTATSNAFVDATYSDDSTNPYDDMLIWLSPQVLFSKMISAGQLP